MIEPSASSPARWTPARLGRLIRTLDAAPLRALSTGDLLTAWSASVETFRDPASPQRRRLGAELAELCRLSPPALEAGLEAVLGGVRREKARELIEGARPARNISPILIISASNLPGLAVQPLLPSLAVRRPAIVKSPSAEALFAPAFVAELVRREPRLAPALAAITWPGGEEELEAPLLEHAGTVVAYGGAEAISSLESRAPGKVVAYGPKTSLAILGPGAAPAEAAPGLARDVALFDQRGCLSIQAVYTVGDVSALARALAAELEKLARRWPPFPADRDAAAAVQAARAEAAMRGLETIELELAAGTVIVEPEPAFRISPGLRTVRLHPLAELSRLPEILAPWRGRLQGAALAGTARTLEDPLKLLGISRFSPPGELQSPDATWHNGGISPLDALSRVHLE